MKRTRRRYNSIEHFEQRFNKLMSTTFEYNGVPINIVELGWGWNWDGAKRRFGRTNATKKLITISKPIAKMNLEQSQVLDTVILHEIAHAIHYVMYGELNHNQRWVSICLAIGGDGEQYYNPELVNPALSKYLLKCKYCGFEVSKNRMPKYMTSCSQCDTKFNPKYRLQIFQRY